ncbi:MAG TPA: DEAD/DEAH box helicase [Candidatus Xenobia bacterium]
MDLFSAPTRTWFQERFAAPTPAQTGAWQAIAGGDNVLVVAPTGSGKTLAAFLWSLDRLAHSGPKALRVLYVSPLKALAFDVERNLRAPLQGLRDAAQRLGVPVPAIEVGVRTGDTPADERRRLPAHPPDILITTPESLFLLLTSQARQMLKTVDTVIVDEVHAVAGTKRGAHLALSLERLDVLLERPARRIGLSATARPLDDVARFLGGVHEVKIVHPPAMKAWDLRVEVPVEDMTAMEEGTLWTAIEQRLVELVRGHRSTIIFANSRRLSERLCARLNEVAEEDLARAHHGSVSREQRRAIEEDLKAGRLRAVVATSSLELGIDMGAVDLVVQVESPPSVASGLQRIGRAGHGVGEVSRGVVLPKWRGDLVSAAVVSERMQEGAIESIRYLRNPLDVLAQHVVAMVAMDDWKAEGLGIVVRRAASFAGLPQSALDGVLDMLSGKYPADEFAELRPHVNWDRDTGILSGRRHAQHLAVVNGGTIPDRGLFGVFLVGDKPHRVGELDEEMVYESERGDTFTLGASTWRIEEITIDKVMVSPAPGEPGKTPFWHGDAPGRPVELGRAYGAFMQAMLAPDAERRLQAAGLSAWAAGNLRQYLQEQIQATGHLPDDKTLVVERFKDELGDWRVCIHSPFGSPVHVPWAMAIVARVRERLGLAVQTMPTDDGIVLRLPEADAALPSDSILFEPDEIEALVTSAVGSSALFASRFRECAARALLLPRRRPGQRTPLWQQRQKSANLLQVAAGYGSFPIVLETMRECLQDVFDLPALKTLMADLRARRIRLVQVDTDRPSPFARSLLFGFLGTFIYEGDAPLAERRAAALAVDSVLLAELLGQAELRDLLDGGELERLELELQRLTPERRLRDADDMHDALRVLGDMSVDELEARGGLSDWLGRALQVRIQGEIRYIAGEDAARYRDALGTALPLGVPQAFLEPVRDARADLVGRYARTHGPFHPEDVSNRLGLDTAAVVHVLHQLEGTGRVVRGEFRPGGHGIEWCDAEVLRTLRRRSLARLRQAVEAVPQEVLSRFVPVWQNVGAARAFGPDALLRAVEQLQGVPVPASALEKLILPARVENYTASLLDGLCAAGEVVWAGRGALGTSDGYVSLYLAQDAEELLPWPCDTAWSDLHQSILSALSGGGALFFRQISDRLPGISDKDIVAALWDLVWDGRVTNDTLAPLRSVLQGATAKVSTVRRRLPRGPALPSRLGPPGGAGRWGLVPRASDQLTRRRTVLAEQLLDRYGVLTRAAVMAEGIEGGFAGIYPILKAYEEAGRCRRGYFIEGLGAAQFAMPGAVDRLRQVASNPPPDTLVLAATDPANVWGAALPWPRLADAHPARKPGSLVVLVDGHLVFYLERGGRTLLAFDEDPGRLSLAVGALGRLVRDGRVGRIIVERVNGVSVFDSPLLPSLGAQGFRETPKGLILRA